MNGVRQKSGALILRREFILALTLCFVGIETHQVDQLFDGCPFSIQGATTTDIDQVISVTLKLFDVLLDYPWSISILILI